MLRVSPMVTRISYTLPWLAAILLLCSPVTHAEEGGGDSPPLRVLTYNLLHDGHGQDSSRAAPISKSGSTCPFKN